MLLRYNVVSTVMVDYGDLERFIKEVYGHDYEIPDGEEKCNGSTITYELKAEPLSDWDRLTLSDFCQGHHPRYALLTIMQDLVNNCHIPAGNYSINISW